MRCMKPREMARIRLPERHKDFICTKGDFICIKKKLLTQVGVKILSVEK